MNITPDYLIERARNKNQLIKWKIISLILLLIIMVFLPKKKLFMCLRSPAIKEDYIASVAFEGVIYDNLAIIKKLGKLANDKYIKALIVQINSPGGSIVGSEMLYNSLRKIAKNKPVVAVMNSVAASGAYLMALGTDYIIAHNGTITGSIGVLLESAEITELAKKIGVKFNSLKSSHLKANPSLIEKLHPEAENAVMENILDIYDYFTEVVAKRRNLKSEFVKKIADGRIYSAKLALRYKLIDEIGNEDSAIKWLEEKKGLRKDLKVVEIKLNAANNLINVFFDRVDSIIATVFYKKTSGIKAI